MFLQIPFCANPFVSHPYKTPGGVGRHTPFLLPDSLPCERANAPFNKYLWNEHLQKCVKTKDFNYLQNEHFSKLRGEGAASLQRPLVFVRGTASTYPMLPLAASHALHAFCAMLLPVISSEAA